MSRIFARAWIATALAVLLWGIVAALTGELANDVGWGPLWYLAVALLAFPTGTVFAVVTFAALGTAATLLLGTDRYFALVAEVCLAWAAAVAGGMVQGALIRRWKSREKLDPQ